MECWSDGVLARDWSGIAVRQKRSSGARRPGITDASPHYSNTPLLHHSASRYGVAVGFATGSGVADCSGLGLALLSGDSFGVGEVCALTR